MYIYKTFNSNGATFNGLWGYKIHILTLKLYTMNIADRIKWWESGAGETKAGTFNLQLYIAYLTIRNNK